MLNCDCEAGDLLVASDVSRYTTCSKVVHFFSNISSQLLDRFSYVFSVLLRKISLQVCPAIKKITSRNKYSLQFETQRVFIQQYTELTKYRQLLINLKFCLKECAPRVRLVKKHGL